MFLKQIFAIEEQLRVADVGQRVKRAGLVRVPAKRDRTSRRNRCPAHFVRAFAAAASGQSETVCGKEREPRVVEHDQIVSARSRVEIYQFFLKKICVRKLSDVDVDAGLSFVVECGLFERFAFDARDYGQRQLFAGCLLLVLAATHAEDERGAGNSVSRLSVA